MTKRVRDFSLVAAALLLSSLAAAASPCDGPGADSVILDWGLRWLESCYSKKHAKASGSLPGITRAMSLMWLRMCPARPSNRALLRTQRKQLQSCGDFSAAPPSRSLR